MRGSAGAPYIYYRRITCLYVICPAKSFLFLDVEFLFSYSFCVDKSFFIFKKSYKKLDILINYSFVICTTKFQFDETGQKRVNVSLDTDDGTCKIFNIRPIYSIFLSISFYPIKFALAAYTPGATSFA